LQQAAQRTAAVPQPLDCCCGGVPCVLLAVCLVLGREEGGGGGLSRGLCVRVRP
jgi:hypothetical protein